MIRLILCLFLLQAFGAHAQLTEDFSDGEYSKDPVWIASPNSWIVNASGRLQSSNTIAGSSYYIATANELAIEAQWEFSIELQFNTSSANYVDVFLTASASDLSSPKTTGYFVRIGNTQDEVSLYRKDADLAPVKLIDGADGITNKSRNTLRIKITRNASGTFTLYTDSTGMGSSYKTEGVQTDSTYTRSAYFGFLVRQSTSSFFQKHFIDFISIAPFVPDLVPPSLVSATATSLQTLDLLFTEAIDTTSALLTSLYTVDNSVGYPFQVDPDAGNPALLHLQFPVSFRNGAWHTITISGIQDKAGNTSGILTASFSFYRPVLFDVIIDELFADPSPAVGLPPAEWIEIKNRSGHDLNIKDWTLRAGSTTSGKFPSLLLKADSFVVLTATANTAALQPYGRVLGIPSFPALDNDGALLEVLSASGDRMHAVDYKNTWYQSASKREGGWSLEMIDTEAPCLGSGNWSESRNAAGGTPGITNSVNGLTADHAPPDLEQISILTETTLWLRFTEPLDSSYANASGHYSINGTTVKTVLVTGPFFQEALVFLSGPLEKSRPYTLHVSASDCKGNSGELIRNIGLPEAAHKNDLLINEILFDPKPSGEDYVEVFNNSTSIIDVKNVRIASRNAGGSLRSIVPITASSWLLFPGEYLVVTEDKAALQREYLVKDEKTIVEVSSLPSLPNDTGVIVLINDSSQVLDELSYSVKWHFPLITNPEGVALERIDPAAPTQNPSNWHSAASTSGYGTPGYRNSQFRQQDLFTEAFHVSPRLFSPDNDGMDDEATLSYQLESSGYVANVFVFNDQGRQVRHLAKNDLLSQKGYWKWDGLDEKRQSLPAGIYIFYIELFHLQGEKKAFKITTIKK